MRGNDVVEVVPRRAEIVLETQPFELRAIDENDLRLDVDLRLPDVERPRVGDEVLDDGCQRR